jgi:hypothetical protein
MRRAGRLVAWGARLGDIQVGSREDAQRRRSQDLAWAVHIFAECFNEMGREMGRTAGRVARVLSGSPQPRR